MSISKKINSIVPREGCHTMEHTPEAITVTRSLSIPLSEMEWRYTMSSGPGGQNVNRTQSACVLIWNYLESPSLRGLELSAEVKEKLEQKASKSGLVAFKCQTFRDQKRNADECVERFTQWIRSVFFKPKKRIATKPTKSSQRRRLQSKKHLSEKKSQRRKDF